MFGTSFHLPFLCRKQALLVVVLFYLCVVVPAVATAAARVEKTFTLSAIYFNETRLLSSFDLLPIYENDLGARITINRLKEICNDITRYYHQQGYAGARCRLPYQVIKSGIVHLEIQEGVIGSVTLAGIVDPGNARLNDYLDHITLMQPVNETELEYVQRLINALPGTSVKAYTRPVEDSDMLDLLFEVEQTVFSGEVYINNRGSELVGPVQGGLSLSSVSLLGVNELLQLNLLAAEQTDELKFLEINSAWPTTDEGSKLLLEASMADSIPGDFLNPSEVDVQVYMSRLGWSLPLMLTAKNTLLLTSWLDYFKAETNSNGQLITFDEIYKLMLSLDHVTDTQRSYLKTNISYSHGLSGLNTTAINDNGLVSLGNEDFDTLRFDVFYRTAVSTNILLSLQSTGQYAFSNLPVSEYITFGGEVMGSAYDPAEFFGDHGIGANIRLGYVFDKSGISTSYTQWYTQYDIVKVWNEQLDFQVSGASLGTGITFGSDRYYLDLQLAKPLTKNVFLENSKDARFFGSFRLFF